MSYLVLARKWRPRRFSELVGQEHVVRALTNALDTGRVAKPREKFIERVKACETADGKVRHRIEADGT